MLRLDMLEERFVPETHRNTHKGTIGAGMANCLLFHTVTLVESAREIPSAVVSTFSAIQRVQTLLLYVFGSEHSVYWCSRTRLVSLNRASRMLSSVMIAQGTMMTRLFFYNHVCGRPDPRPSPSLLCTGIDD